MNPIKIVSGNLLAWVFVLITVLQPVHTKAQNTRFSFDPRINLPITFASIPNKLAFAGGIGLRFNITQALSMQACFDIGTMRGEQKNVLGTTANIPGNFIWFNNRFFSYSGNFQYNLGNMSRGSGMLQRFNTSLILGAGWVQSDVVAQRWNGFERSFNFAFYVFQPGFSVRYYLNPSLDLNFSAIGQLTQTQFMDAIATDPAFDHFLMISTGVSYKIGASRRRQHIEWDGIIVRKKIKEPKEPRKPKKAPEPKPVEAQPVTQDAPPSNIPVDAAPPPVNKKVPAEDIAVMGRAKETPPEIRSETKEVPVLAQPEVSEETPKAVQQPRVIYFNRDSVVGIVEAKRKLERQRLLNQVPAVSDSQQVEQKLTPLQVDTAAKEEPVARVSEPAGVALSSPAPIQEEVQPNTTPATPMVKPADNNGVKPQVNLNPVKPVDAIKESQETVKTAVAPEVNTGQAIGAAPAQGYKPSKGILAPEGVVVEMPTAPSSKVTPEPKQITASNKPFVNESQALPSAQETPARAKVASRPDAVSERDKARAITRPLDRYNVIVASFFSANRAVRYRKSLRKEGYQAEVFRSRAGSRMLRVSIYSGSDLKEAIVQMKKARKEIDSGTWIHFYKGN